jgi:hypothetical protein
LFKSDCTRAYSFEENKVFIGKKDRQYNDQLKSDKRTNNDLQEKFKDIKEVLTCRRSNLHTIQWAKENSNRRKKISQFALSGVKA